MKIELKSKDEPVLITRTAYWYSPKEKNSIVGDILKGDSEDFGWLTSSFVNLTDEYTYSFYGIRPVSANYVGYVLWLILMAELICIHTVYIQ